MSIRLRNVDPTDALHPNNNLFLHVTPSTSVASIAAAVTASGVAAGTAVAVLASGYILGSPVSIAATTGGAVNATIAFRIVGFNQFDERVEEVIDLVAVASGSTRQSLHCYKRVISITVVSVGVSNAATVSFGTQGTVLTDVTTRIKLALPFRPNPWTVTTGANAQTAQNAEFIFFATSAMALRNIGGVDFQYANVSINESMSGTLSVARLSLQPSGLR